MILLKGQMQQVFIYIMTIVVIGIILLLGYRAIDGLIAKGCDVEQTTFKSSMENYISKYSSFGSLHKETISVPCDYRQICFVDADKINDDTFNTDNGIIESSVQAGIEQNIFLEKKGVTDPIGFMKEVDIESVSGIECIENRNGKFYITFEGLGRSTRITGT